MRRVRSICGFIAAVAIVICAYANVVSLYQETTSLGPRESEEVGLKEERLIPIRMNLLSTHYQGDIAFVTNRTLEGLPPTPEDDKEWGQFQYSILPWKLVRDRMNTPFVLVDFWDGTPDRPLDGLEKFYDAGGGLILFREKHRP
jgi:hypothetical protein